MTDARRRLLEMDTWTVLREVYDASENAVYETLFTLANGNLSLRGIEEFSSVSFPGTYLAGVFDKFDAPVTELVNLPNPLILRIYVDNHPLNLERNALLEYRRTLDMRSGTLHSHYVLETGSGKRLRIESLRFVSRAHVGRFGVRYRLTPLNFSGKILVEHCVDTATFNGNLDPNNKIQHYVTVCVGESLPGVHAAVKTHDKGHIVAFRTALKGFDENGENALRFRKFRLVGGSPSEIFTLFARESVTYTVEKYGVVHSSRHRETPLESADGELLRFYHEGLETELAEHGKVLESVWKDIDVEIDGDEVAQRAIRFNIFHLFQCASDDPRVSIGARGLHGEGYKGHVFWDTEIFMFPFFLYSLPKYAKNLLLYRYHTLEGARRNAQLNGYRGAQFPWESADDGLEVTPKWGEDYLGNPVRIWTGDEEFHINSDIAVALVHYHVVTGDDEFMRDYGVELLLETGRFWASRVEYNEREDRYEINRVIGPDEFHEHVNNNVYTNYLARWNLLKAKTYYGWLREKYPDKFEALKSHLGLTDTEVEGWERIAERVHIPRKPGELLIEQFEGYFELEDHEITEWDENGLPKWPKTVNLAKLGETKLIKQPDVVMLMLVLPEEFTREEMKVNYEYYEKRTMHKSSLSPSMYSIMGLKVGDTHNAYKYFLKTVLVDLEDNQGNTNNGFHAASAGGAWQCVVNGFGGMTLNKDGVLEFNPWLPEHWRALGFTIHYRGIKLNVTVGKEKLIVQTDGALKIVVGGVKRTLVPGVNEIKLNR